jgi:hypothetical protein
MQVSSIETLNASAIPIPGQPGRLYLPFASLDDCASCGGSQDVTGVPGYVPASMLDTPYRVDTTGVALAKSYGRVMGLDALAQVDENDVKPNVAMVRATNSASLVAAMLLKFKPEARQAVLEELGGIAWTTSVLKLAGKMPGVLGISDAVRFSLGLHFIVGVYDDAAKKSNSYTEAYNKTVAFFRGIEKGEQLAENALDGLGALGANVFGKIGDAMKKAGQAVVGAAKTAVKAVEKVADFTSDLLCKGFKALLGDKLGGMICFLFTKLIDIIKASIQTIIKIVEAAGTALLGFLEKTMRGQFLDAVMSLMKGVTKIVFFSLGPAAVGLFGMKFDELEKLADKVSDKAPFFPLSVTLAIVGVIPVPSLPGVSTMILALLPAICVLAAPLVKKVLTKMSIDDLEKAIDKFVKIALIIVVGYMKLQELWPKFKAGMQAYLKKKGGVGGAVSSVVSDAWKNLQKGWDKVVGAFKQFKLKDVATSLSALLSTLGEAFVGGLLTDSDSTEFGNDAKALVDGVKESTKSIDQQEKDLKKAQADIIRALPQNQRQQVVMDQAKQLKAPQAAVTIADMIRDKLTSKEKDQFIRDFKAQYRGPDIIVLTNVKPGAAPSAAAKKGVSQVPAIVTSAGVAAKPATKKSSGFGPAIAAATGGALIAGPIGAGAGFIIGLLAGKKA